MVVSQLLNINIYKSFIVKNKKNYKHVILVLVIINSEYWEFKIFKSHFNNKIDKYLYN